eukprot:9482622-Pyramimonas_sp.AAC.1
MHPVSPHLLNELKALDFQVRGRAVLVAGVGGALSKLNFNDADKFRAKRYKAPEVLELVSEANGHEIVRAGKRSVCVICGIRDWSRGAIAAFP